MRVCFGGAASPDTLLDQEIQAAAEAGFNCLDLWAPRMDAYLASYPLSWLATYLREQRVYVAAISGTEPLTFGSRDDSLLAQARFFELCTHLDVLGGGIVTVHPGQQIGTDITEQATTHQTVHVLRTLSSLAAPFDIRIAFEFRHDKQSTVRSLSHSQDIVERVARVNVGLALSLHHIERAHSRLDTLDANKLWLVHLDSELGTSIDASTSRDRFGSSALDSQRTCAQLAAKGFHGPYSIQLASQGSSIKTVAQMAMQMATELFSSV